MSTSEFKSPTKRALSLGTLLLFIGIVLFLTNNAGTMLEKIGLVLFTCGALFVGAAYTFVVAWKSELKKNTLSQDSINKNEKPTNFKSTKEKKSPTRWKDFLIAGLAGVVLVETMGFALKSLGILIFDYDLFKQLLIVIIPIIGGSITTYKITNSWQIHRDKIGMKSEVLELFDNSIRQKGVLIHVLVLDMIKTYGKYDPSTFNSETAKSSMKIDIPSNLDEQPKVKFHDKFEQLQKDISETTAYNHKFLSKLRLYYRNDSFEKRWYDLDRRMAYLDSLVYRLVSSTTKEEFIKYSNEYDSKRDELRELLKQFNLDLADTKIRNIPV